ncbi:MAG: glycosyltransferase family 39 protein [Bacteroidota bacterium]
MNDSPRYLAYASDLNEGFHFDPLNFWYFTYVFFIFLHQLFSDHLLPIIMSQYLLGYLAVLSLYATTRIITENEVISTLSSMLFILFPDNIFWHSYILTESLYSSLLCFAFLFAIRYMKAKSHKNLVLLIFSVVLCFFCRPTSPALVFALIMPFCIKFLSYPSYRIAKITALFIILVGVLALANEMISMHRVMLIYEKGDIIFAMHQVPNSPFHDLLRVAPPADLYLPENEKELILAMLEFVVNNPLYWLKLFVSKLILYVTHIRPYWSWGHIIAVILIIWPSVFFGFSAVKKRLVHKPLLIPFLTYFLVHLLIVCNTWVDWDARFFTPLFPVLALLAAIGLHHEYEKFIKPWFIKTHI